MSSRADRDYDAHLPLKIRLDAASAYAFPETYTGYPAPQPDSVKNNIEVIYGELK